MCVWVCVCVCGWGVKYIGREASEAMVHRPPDRMQYGCVFRMQAPSVKQCYVHMGMHTMRLRRITE